MRKRMMFFAAALGTLLSSSVLSAQEDKVTVPFRDASRPRKLVVEVFNGSIDVKGYDGKDAIIESSGSNARQRNSGRRPNGIPEGMHQIGQRGGFEVIEDSNTVKVVAGVMSSGNISIQVPVETALVLRSTNGGHISVENISGEIDANNMNGAVSITNVSGSVVANSMNGKVVVTLNKVLPNKNMSFSTMNGNVEVTLPADVKANVKMKSDNGEIWTDFDIKLGQTNRTKVEDNRSGGGKYRVHIDRTVEGTINGGGPEMSFTTYNGRIVIGKK